MHRLQTIVAALLTTLILVSCGGEAPQASTETAAAVLQPSAETRATDTPPTATLAPTTVPATPTTEEAKGVTLQQVTFAKGIENQAAISPGSTFHPDEPIFLILDISGRPKQGVITTNFRWHDSPIVSASVDLAEANGGILFSIGQSTFAHFSLTHKAPLPISDKYYADVMYNDQQLGSYPFEVVPPTDALPSKLLEAALARDVDENYTPIDPQTTFGPTQQVVLAGTADLGLATWLQAEWYIDGKLQEAATRSFSMQEDKAATPFAFSFLPDGGWSLGTHEVVLLINDEAAGRYSFTISDTIATDPTAVEAAPTATLAPDAAVTSEAPATSDTALGLTFATPEQYTHPTGLFQIDIPEDWEMTDSTDADGAYVFWLHPTGQAIVTVFITERSEQLTQEQLADELQSFIVEVRAEPDAQINAPEPQGDGSVLIGWSYSSGLNADKVTMQAMGYIEQRDNKLSVLIVDVPQAEFSQLWENGLSQLINSYRIDPSAPITQ